MLPTEKEWNRKEIHSGNWVFVLNTFFMSSCCQGKGYVLDNTVHWITGKSIVQSFKVIIIKWSIGWLWCICNILSDGMSRTGVFIAAMCEVERVKVEGEVDFFQTIKAMRKQRPHMVYNKVKSSHAYTAIQQFTAAWYIDLLDSHATHYTIWLTVLRPYMSLYVYVILNKS